MSRTFDHTGLNKMLLMSDKCSECKTTENVEHVLLHCRKYNEERKMLNYKLNKAGNGTLRVHSEEQERVKDAQRAGREDSNDTGLCQRM